MSTLEASGAQEMTGAPNPGFDSAFRSLSLFRIAGVSAVLIGGVVLIGGWTLDIATLRGLLPGSRP